MDFQNPVFLGIAAGTLVTLIVQGLKMLGLSKDYAAWASLVVSVLLVGMGLLTNMYPAAADFVNAAIAAVVVWLTSIGIYEKGRDVLGNNPEAIDGEDVKR